MSEKETAVFKGGYQFDSEAIFKSSIDIEKLKSVI